MLVNQTIKNLDFNENQTDKNFNSKENKLVRRKVWEYLKQSKTLVIFAGIFAACSGAIWSAYGIVIASSVDALANIFDIDNQGKIMAGWFILVAALAGIFISIQKYE